MQTSKLILMAAAGGIVGGIVALLATPRRGSEMRQRLKDIALAQLDNLLEKAETQLENAHQKALRQESAGNGYG